MSACMTPCHTHIESGPVVARGRFTAQPSQRPHSAVPRGSFRNTTVETLGSLPSPDHFSEDTTKGPRISYCDDVSDHDDPRSSTTTRRFLGGLMAVSRALIIKSDHIC